MERHSMLPFRIGQEVEARFNDPGYRGAWFRCRVQEIKDSTRGDPSYLLEYLDFDQDPSWSQARQPDPAAKSVYWSTEKRKPLIWMIRPPAPPVIHQSDLENFTEAIRKKQKESAMVAIFNNQYMVGDMVDWWEAHCFWTGRITEVLIDMKQVKLVLPSKPHGEGGTYTASMKNLRPAFSWTLTNQWKPVAPKPCKGQVRTDTERLRIQLVSFSGNSSNSSMLQQCRFENSGANQSRSVSRGFSSHSGEKIDEVMSDLHFAPDKKQNGGDIADLVMSLSIPDSNHLVKEEKGDGIGKEIDHSAGMYRKKSRRKSRLFFPSETNENLHTEISRRRSVCNTSSFCLSDSDVEELKEFPDQKPFQPAADQGYEVEAEAQTHVKGSCGDASIVKDGEEVKVEPAIVEELRSAHPRILCSVQVNAENPGSGVDNIAVKTATAMANVVKHDVVNVEPIAGVCNFEKSCDTQGITLYSGTKDAKMLDGATTSMVILDNPCAGEVVATGSKCEFWRNSGSPREVLTEGHLREQKRKGNIDQVSESVPEGQPREEEMRGEKEAARCYKGRLMFQTVRKAIRHTVWRKRRQALSERRKFQLKRKSAHMADSARSAEFFTVNYDRMNDDDILQTVVPSSAPSTPVYGENRDSFSGSRTKWDLQVDDMQIMAPTMEDPQLVVSLQIETEKEVVAVAQQQRLKSAEWAEQPVTCLPTTPGCCEEVILMDVDNTTFAEPCGKEIECQGDGASCPAERIFCNNNDLEAELDSLERLTERIYDLKVQLQGLGGRKWKRGVWKVVDRNKKKLGEEEFVSIKGSLPKREGKLSEKISEEAANVSADPVKRSLRARMKEDPSKGVSAPPQMFIEGMEGDAGLKLEAGPEPGLAAELQICTGSTMKMHWEGRRKRGREEGVGVDGRKKRTFGGKATAEVVTRDIVEAADAIMELPRMRGSLRNQNKKLMTSMSQLPKKMSSYREPQEIGTGLEKQTKGSIPVDDRAASKQQSLKGYSLTGNKQFMGKKENHIGSTHIGDPLAYELQQKSGKSFTGHKKQHLQASSGGMATSGQVLRKQFSPTEQGEAEVSTCQRGGEGGDGKTNQHKIKLLPNKNWCFRAVSDSKPVWVGNCPTEEAALFAYDMVSGKAKSSSLRSEEKTVMTSDVPPTTRQIESAIIERVECCGVSELPSTAGQACALNKVAIAKEGNYETHANWGNAEHKESSALGGNSDMGNQKVGYALGISGTIEYEINKDGGVNPDDVAASEDERLKTLVTISGKVGPGPSTKSTLETSYTTSALEPSVDIESIVRTARDAGLNNSISEEPVVTVKLPEALSVGQVGNEASDGTLSHNEKKYLGKQADIAENVKEEIVIPTVSLSCYKSSCSAQPLQSQCVLRHGDLQKAKTVLDCVSMRGFLNDEELAAARQAGMALWRSIYCSMEDPTVALQGQELIDRLKILSRTYREIVDDADAKKVVLGSGKCQEDIYIGHYRTEQELKAACRMLSRCKKEFLKSLATIGPPSTPLAPCDPNISASHAGHAQVLQVGIPLSEPDRSHSDIPVSPQVGLVSDPGRPNVITLDTCATGNIFNNVCVASELVVHTRVLTPQALDSKNIFVTVHVGSKQGFDCGQVNIPHECCEDVSECRTQCKEGPPSLVKVNDQLPEVQGRQHSEKPISYGGAPTKSLPLKVPDNIIVLKDDDDDDNIPAPAHPGASNFISRSVPENVIVIGDDDNLLNRVHLGVPNPSSSSSTIGQPIVGRIIPAGTTSQCPPMDAREFDYVRSCLQASHSPETGPVISNDANDHGMEGGSGSASVPCSNRRAPLTNSSTRRTVYNCCEGTDASKIDYILVRALHCDICDWLMHTECAIQSKQLTLRRSQHNGQEHEQVVYMCNCQKSWGVLPSMLGRAKYILELILNHQSESIGRLNIQISGKGQDVVAALNCLKEILSRIRRLLQHTKSQVLKSVHNMVCKMLFKTLAEAENVDFQGFVVHINNAIAYIKGAGISST